MSSLGDNTRQTARRNGRLPHGSRRTLDGREKKDALMSHDVRGWGEAAWAYGTDGRKRAIPGPRYGVYKRLWRTH